MGEDFGAFCAGGGGTRPIGAEYGFTVGDAGGKVEGYEDADAVWGEGVGRARGGQPPL